METNMQVAAQAVEIRIFSAAGSSQSLSAVTDPRIAHNVIRRTTINALGHKWTNISPNFEPDLCGTATRPVGSFELTWHMEGRSKSWPDTFLVVEEADCDVILGRAASQKTTIGCYKGGYPAAITKLSKAELQQQKEDDKKEKERVKKEKADQEAKDKARRERERHGR